MKKIPIGLLLFIATTVQAQEVVSTQGDSYSNSSGNISFTIGETVIATEAAGGYELTQGFHQTNWNFLGVEDHDLNYEIVVYPNPSTDVLNIKTPSFENVNYTLIDVTGRVVIQNSLEGNITTIDASQLAPGNYSLVLIDASQNILKTFKLNKQQ
jgi:hypothetical protein